jgi:hypothetical protein
MGIVGMGSSIAGPPYSLPPYTLWNLLDNVLIQLASIGDSICRDRISGDRVYNTLVDLICGVNVEKAVDELEISKPYYHYILVIFYLVFQGRRLEVAYKLYRKLAKEYEERRALFDPDERVSLAAIGRAVERLWILRQTLNIDNIDEHRAEIKHDLEILTREIENIGCNDHGWGCIFRDLVTAMLTPDIEHTIEKMNNIIAKLKEKTRYEPLDIEVIEGYNIFTENAITSIYTFITSIAQEELKKIGDVKAKIQLLEEKEKELQTRLNRAREWEKKFKVYYEHTAQITHKIFSLWPLIGVIVTFLIVNIVEYLLMRTLFNIIILIFLLAYILLKSFSWHYNRRIKNIRREISELSKNKLEEIAKIIWGS